MSVPQILVQQLLLRVARFRSKLLYFRIDMPIANQNVRPPIIIHIEESATPAQKLRVTPEPSGERRILERSAADVVVERRRIPSEIRFDDIEVSVKIVIGGRDAHSGLRLAIGAERATGF